jgi:hypothetical protein
MSPQHWGRSIANVPRSAGGPAGRFCKTGNHWRPILGGKIRGVGTQRQHFICADCLRASTKAVTA